MRNTLGGLYLSAVAVFGCGLAGCTGASGEQAPGRPRAVGRQVQASKDQPREKQRGGSQRQGEQHRKAAAGKVTITAAGAVELPPPQPIPVFVLRGISWLAEAQHENGGWGAGSHAHQEVRDPHNVQTDPATTAFVGLALLRSGHTPVEGQYRESVLRATRHLVETVEASPEEGPKITSLEGTQPQSKLGPLVDTSMTAQFLARVLPILDESHELRYRVDAALTKCLRKLEVAQKEDGSWNFAGWAPVLQSSLSCSALELAQVAGMQVDDEVLERARDYQKGNVDRTSGRAKTDDAAGVELYSFAGGKRAGAAQAKAASDAVERAKERGDLPAEAEVSEETLTRAGLEAAPARKLAQAFEQDAAQNARLADEALLAGFGNNGGEEYLSYLLTSESLVITGGPDWDQWNRKMHERLEKIQSPDGSWSGHHCITSPVFCTAAVVQCLTTDRDAPVLVKIASAAAPEATGTPATR